MEAAEEITETAGGELRPLETIEPPTIFAELQCRLCAETRELDVEPQIGAGGEIVSLTGIRSPMGAGVPFRVSDAFRSCSRSLS